MLAFLQEWNKINSKHNEYIGLEVVWMGKKNIEKSKENKWGWEFTVLNSVGIAGLRTGEI